MKRRAPALCALVCALLAFGWITPLRATDGDAQLVNAERTSRGIPALTIDSGLNACAKRHSDAQAAAGYIYHNLSQTAYKCAGSWSAYGENVGAGPSVDAVHQAFMASPEHRRNILCRCFNRLGTGVTWQDNIVYVTEIYVFRQAARRRTTARAAPAKPHTSHARTLYRPAPHAKPRAKKKPPASAWSVSVAMLLRMQEYAN